MSSMDRFVRWLTGEDEDASTPEPHHSPESQTDRAGRSALPPVENNAAGPPYNVTIEEANVAPGQTYWRAVRVYHLAPNENGGRHHIFFDALTPEGERAFHTQGRIRWDGGEHTVPIDKPMNEPGANFPMWKWQVCTVEMLGMPSDQIHNLRTDHPDEPNPDGSSSGNTLFHHSFFVVFQQVTAPEQVGAILGRVENGQVGERVALLRTGHLVEETTTDERGTFRFTDIMPGSYQIRVQDQEATVTVRGEEEAQVIITLPPRRSVIEGVVHNGAGLLLRLVKQGEILAEGTLGQSGAFRLRDLAQGSYFLHVAAPGAVEPLLISGELAMDGLNSRRVELTVPTQETSGDGSPFSHYILFGRGEQSRAYLAELAPFLARKGLAFGFDRHEAAHAQRVTAIGDGSTLPEFDLIYLATQGVQVTRLTGTPSEIKQEIG
jgi:hypothetical protein